MERLRSLKTLLYLLCGIALFETAFLAFQVRPSTFTQWLTVAVIAVTVICLGVISLGLLKELIDKENKK